MIRVVPLKVCWLNHTEMSCYFSHLLAETGSCDFKESLNSGFPLLHSVEALKLLWTTLHDVQRCLEVVCSQTSSLTGMSVRDIWLNWQERGSYSLGGFHCLSHKDRSTWGYDKTVHIYYIHVRTVVREINKGLKCVNLEHWSCLPLERDWSLLELSPH